MSSTQPTKQGRGSMMTFRRDDPCPKCGNQTFAYQLKFEKGAPSAAKVPTCVRCWWEAPAKKEGYSMNNDANTAKCSTNPWSPGDPEIAAIRTVVEALEPLDEAARHRVIWYVAKRLRIALVDITPAPAASAGTFQYPAGKR